MTSLLRPAIFFSFFSALSFGTEANIAIAPPGPRVDNSAAVAIATTVAPILTFATPASALTPSPAIAAPASAITQAPTNVMPTSITIPWPAIAAPASATTPLPVVAIATPMGTITPPPALPNCQIRIQLDVAYANTLAPRLVYRRGPSTPSEVLAIDNILESVTANGIPLNFKFSEAQPLTKTLPCPTDRKVKLTGIAKGEYSVAKFFVEEHFGSEEATPQYQSGNYPNRANTGPNNFEYQIQYPDTGEIPMIVKVYVTKVVYAARPQPVPLLKFCATTSVLPNQAGADATSVNAFLNAMHMMGGFEVLAAGNYQVVSSEFDMLFRMMSMGDPSRANQIFAALNQLNDQLSTFNQMTGIMGLRDAAANPQTGTSARVLLKIYANVTKGLQALSSGACHVLVSWSGESASPGTPVAGVFSAYKLYRNDGSHDFVDFKGNGSFSADRVNRFTNRLWAIMSSPCEYGAPGYISLACEFRNGLLRDLRSQPTQ